VRWPNVTSRQRGQKWIDLAVVRVQKIAHGLEQLTRRRCPEYGERFVLPELVGITGDRCWTCAEARQMTLYRQGPLFRRATQAKSKIPGPKPPALPPRESLKSFLLPEVWRLSNRRR
jgi:hypothetical protein